jgi:hypothetical protein
VNAVYKSKKKSGLTIKTMERGRKDERKGVKTRKSKKGVTPPEKTNIGIRK